MLNNITNFFNLIKTGKVKTQLDGTDLLPIGTRDTRFSGQYQPTMIKYSDLVAGMIGGSDGQVLFKDNGVANGAANLYWDKVNDRLTGGPVQASAPWILQVSQNSSSNNTNLMFYSPGAWGGLLTMPPSGYYNTMLNGRIIGTDGGVGNSALALGTVTANTSGSNFNIAIGPSSNVTGAKSLAVGYQAVVTTDNATAIGFGATTSTLNGLALGNANSLLQIGGNFTPLARVHIKGQGNTSATSSLLVQNSANTELFRVLDNGAVLINTSSDEGYKLDVNGNGRFKGGLVSAKAGYVGFINDGLYSSMGYNTLPEDVSTVLKIGFGAGTSVTTLLKLDNTTNNSAAGPTTVLLDILANPSQTAPLVQWRNSAGAILGVINSAGNVGIGTSSPSTTLHVIGQATISTALSISGGFVMTESGNVHTFTAPVTNRTIRFITNSQSYSLFSTGNFAIGTTTDAGFKLDVNGTARVQGDLTLPVGNFLNITGRGSFNTQTWTLSNPSLRASIVVGTNITAEFSNTGANIISSLRIKKQASPNVTSIELSADSGPGVMSFGAASDNNQTHSINTVGSFNWPNSSQNLRIITGLSSTGFKSSVILQHDGSIETGNVLIGTSTNVASSLLTLESTTKGFLPPRMTTTEKNAIATPAAGLMVYDNTLNRPCFYNGTSWITL